MSEIDNLQKTQNIDLFEFITPHGPAPYGIADDGRIYLDINLHPGGAMEGMQRLTDQQVEFVPTSAVSCLCPAEWLVAECMGDNLRLGVIDQLLKAIARANK